MVKWATQPYFFISCEQHHFDDIEAHKGSNTYMRTNSSFRKRTISTIEQYVQNFIPKNGILENEEHKRHTTIEL
jgi:hypothetical protein